MSKIIERLRKQYDDYLNTQGKPPTVIQCGEIFKFLLVKELCDFDLWRYQNNTLTMFNINTQTVFI